MAISQIDSTGYRPHAIIVMRLLYCELAISSTYTDKVLISEEYEEYAST